MEEKYIEVNEFTQPYLESLKYVSQDDFKILKRLLHDSGWWSGFNSETTENKIKKLGGVMWQNLQ